MSTLLGTQAQLIIVGQAGTPSRRDVSVSFTPPLKDPPKGEFEGEIIRSNTKGDATIRLKDGREVSAQIRPPLPQGTQLKMRVVAAGAQAKTLRFELPTSPAPRAPNTPDADLPVQGGRAPQSPAGNTGATAPNNTANTQAQTPPTTQIPLDKIKAILTGTHNAESTQKGTPLTLPSTPVEVRVTGHSPQHQTGMTQLILTLVSSTNRQTQDFTLTLPEKLPVGTTLTVVKDPAAKPSAGNIPVKIDAIGIKAEQVPTSPPLPTHSAPSTQTAPSPTLPPASVKLSNSLETLILKALGAERPTPTVAPQPSAQSSANTEPRIRLYPAPNVPVKVTLSSKGTPQFETPVTLQKGASIPATNAANIPTIKTTVPLPAEGSITLTFTAKNAAASTPAPTASAPTQTSAQTPLPAIQSATLTASTPTVNASTGTQVATVLSQMGDGFYSIQPEGRPPLIVQAPSEKPLPVGTKLVLGTKPDGATIITQIILPTLSPAAQAQDAMGTKWDGLFKAIESLYKAGNDSEGTKLYDSIPRMDKGFLGPFMVFADAVSKNDISRFVDRDTVNILRALGIDLSADVSQLHMASRADQASDNQWRNLIFPFLENYGDTPEQGNFFWKRDKSGDGKQPSSQFIFRFGLSELGPIHLDGRVDGKVLNLNMKLENSVDKNFVKGLKALVDNVGSAYGFQAQIDVQVVEELPPPPIDKTTPASNHKLNMNI